MSPGPIAGQKSSAAERLRSTRRYTEWRPREDSWQFGSHGGAAIGELIVRRKMIVRTQVTFSATGERFTPSKVAADFSEAHDPGVIGQIGRYRGVPVPYGSADFDVPDEVPEKIAYVYERAFPFLCAMREAGADDFSLHITYHYDAQCALGFSKEELKMITELDCGFAIDCIEADEPNQALQATAAAPSR